MQPRSPPLRADLVRTFATPSPQATRALSPRPSHSNKSRVFGLRTRTHAHTHTHTHTHTGRSDQYARLRKLTGHVATSVFGVPWCERRCAVGCGALTQNASQRVCATHTVQHTSRNTHHHHDPYKRSRVHAHMHTCTHTRTYECAHMHTHARV